MSHSFNGSRYIYSIFTAFVETMVSHIEHIHIHIYIYRYTRFQKGFHTERYIGRYILLFSCTCARVHFSPVTVQLVKKLEKNMSLTSRELQTIEGFHSRGKHLCKFIGTKENVYIRKEFNSQRIFSVHQHGRRFVVLEHKYGRRDVM